MPTGVGREVEDSPAWVLIGVAEQSEDSEALTCSAKTAPPTTTQKRAVSPAIINGIACDTSYGLGVADLLSPATRTRFRDVANLCPVDQIREAFHDQGFPEQPRLSGDGVRKATAKAYQDAVNWTDAVEVRRFLAVAEEIVRRVTRVWSNSADVSDFHDALRRDGCEVDAWTGQITLPRRMGITIESIRQLRDPSGIEAILRRVEESTDGDPALAIGCAKELVESTAKTVLTERGQAYSETNEKVPALAKKAAVALGLGAGGAKGPDGDGNIMKILGAMSNIPHALAELRNDHGSGHGRSTIHPGLSARHAQLALGAATVWCQMMLDTLGDPDAPWRRDSAAAGEATP